MRTSPMVVRVLAAVFAAAVVLSLAPALAHEEHALHSLTVIDRVYPTIDGIDVRVVHLDAPALVVTNETDEAVTVLGEEGEPFLRIGRDGVRANAESPTTYRSAAPWRDTVPAGVKASNRPRWVVFSEESTWTWFDPRLRVEPGLNAWQVPLMLGGQPITVEGSFEPLQGHGHFITEMTPPAVEGLELRLTQGAIPAIYVRNDSGEVLWVRGDAGEPFLQIGPKGVIANLRSPTYYTSGSTTILEVPRVADAGSPPRWKKVSPYPVWAWLERQAAVPPELFQRTELGAERKTVIEWTSEYRLGDRPLEVPGRVEWVPPRSTAQTATGSGETPWWLIAAVTLVGVAAAGALLLRRPSRPAT